MLAGVCLHQSGRSSDAWKSQKKRLRPGSDGWKSKKNACGWVLTLDPPPKSACGRVLALGNPKKSACGQVKIPPPSPKPFPCAAPLYLSNVMYHKLRHTKICGGLKDGSLWKKNITAEMQLSEVLKTASEPKVGLLSGPGTKIQNCKAELEKV